MAEENNVAPKDLYQEMVDFKTETDEEIADVIDNRSATRQVIRNAKRKQALILHKARQEEDNDIVYELKAYMKSLGKMEWELKGRGY